MSSSPTHSSVLTESLEISLPWIDKLRECVMCLRSVQHQVLLASDPQKKVKPCVAKPAMPETYDHLFQEYYYQRFTMLKAAMKVLDLVSPTVADVY